VWSPVSLASLVLIVILISAGNLAAAESPDAQRIRAEHQQMQQAFAKTLTGVAEECERNGFGPQAEIVRKLTAPVAEQTLDIDDLPSSRLPELSPALPKVELEWKVALRKAQNDFAQQLFLLSRRALNTGMVSEAFLYVRECAFHNPDHDAARRTLGYVNFEGEWSTPFRVQMNRKGLIWHRQFGWLTRAQIERYEQGERYFNGWMSAAKEAALRSDFRNAWEVESEHFVIRTNHSLERAVELSELLETYHRFFINEFAPLFNSPQQLQNLLGGKTTGPASVRQHRVNYYRDRAEYVRELSPKQPGVEVTNGVYMPVDKVAYFFDQPDAPEINEETMFHEVTHQLLSESSTRTFDIAQEQDFWVVEGIACYMESFDPTGDRPTVGNPRHPRIHAARHRIVTEQWLVPLNEFTAMGMRAFQTNGDFKDAQKRYSQATGLTHFLMHYNDGEYRDALIAYIAQIYSPDRRIRLRPKRLDELTGVSMKQLQSEYVGYMDQLDIGDRSLEK